MQCNKSGCKQQFHVTCAQALGLLCEEAGNYLDNVKYCGYCQHHYSKLVSTWPAISLQFQLGLTLSLWFLQKKGGNVKTIPPYKPVSHNVDTSDPSSSPEKDNEPVPMQLVITSTHYWFRRATNFHFLSFFPCRFHQRRNQPNQLSQSSRLKTALTSPHKGNPHRVAVARMCRRRRNQPHCQHSKAAFHRNNRTLNHNRPTKIKVSAAIRAVRRLTWARIRWMCRAAIAETVSAVAQLQRITAAAKLAANRPAKVRRRQKAHRKNHANQSIRNRRGTTAKTHSPANLII